MPEIVTTSLANLAAGQADMFALIFTTVFFAITGFWLYWKVIKSIDQL